LAVYRAFGLLLPDTDFTVPEAARRLAARFPQYAVLLADDGQVTVESDTWEIELRVVEGPEVAEESAHLAERLGGEGELGALAACGRRVEVWSETPDYEMEHFDDFLGVIEVLKSFRGLVPVDPKEPSLL
jgi:hypothetical protein